MQYNNSPAPRPTAKAIGDNIEEARAMEEEFLKKAKEAGLPQKFIDIGLSTIRLMADKGLTYPIDQEITDLLEA